MSLQLARALAEVLDPVAEAGLKSRVCSYRFGPWEIVTSDLEFETEEDRIKYWKDDFDRSAPAYVEWHEKYPDLCESYEHELLRVH